MTDKINIYSKLWESNRSKLNKIDVNNMFPVPGMYSDHVYDHDYELINNFIQITTISSIIEIGCGYGGLARRFLDKIDVNYTVIDIPEMLRLAKHHLSNYTKINYIDSDNITNLDTNYDLLISNRCLDEIDHKYMLYLLDILLPITSNVFIITANFGLSPQEASQGRINHPWLPLYNLLNKYFNDVSVNDFDLSIYTDRRSRSFYMPWHKIYIAKNNKRLSK